jgi:Peptidase family M28
MRWPIKPLSVFFASLVFVFAPALSCAQDPAGAAMNTIRGEALRADMRFLADDLLEGRGTATRGHRIAAKFMGTQFEGLGLQPAGIDGTYSQEVPLRSMRIDAAQTMLSFTRNGQAEVLTFGKDFVNGPDARRLQVDLDAPIVFAGWGVTAPEQKYDDYQGIDPHGKIVAYFYGAPNFESSLKAHYSSLELKAQNAAAHGAVGMLLLFDPALEQMYPFAKLARDAETPKFRWLDKQGKPNDYFPELESDLVVSVAETRKLFEGAPHSADEIFAAAKSGKSFSFPLPVTAKLHSVAKFEDLTSPNIVAKLEGSDPTLKNEYVVYSAHLDHLGIGPAVKGDSIYNGALDNASGSAALLSLARAFATLNPKPKRSILFVSVTGEEAGLLGSDYFATYPTVPKGALVADINIDEIQMLWPVKDIIAFGAEHSSLQADVAKAAEKLQLVESPDPMPEEVVFIRSDQYSFVKQGVPAVMLSPGFQSADAKFNPMALFKEWEESRYHEPQDDMNQPGLDFDSAAKLVRVAFLCGYYVAQDAQRPTWNKPDFFGDHYGHAK